MDNVVCLSRYFVNKQNVRSFGNILRNNALNSKDEESFYKFVVGESLVSKLPEQFKQILLIIKRNLNKLKGGDFKNYFSNNNHPSLNPVDKEFIFNNCWEALNDIIPKHFYGNNVNNKIFKNFVQTVIYSMKRQHFVVGNMFLKWDFSAPTWKTTEDHNTEILLNIVLWVSKYVLAPIICLNFYVTTCKLDSDENKLFYFWKSQWQSFYDKQLSKMLFTKVIRKMPHYSLGRITKTKHSLAERNKLKKFKKDIPKLCLNLKPNNDSRPIVCYKNNLQSTSEKYKIKERLGFLRLLIGKPHMKMETQYNILHSNWLKANKPKLYFIKTDLSNAFGSIDREKLANFLSERYKNIMNSEICVNKKKIISEQYKDLILELRKPFLIRAGSTVFEWRKGLVQGYKYSPALSELYYKSLDEIYFSEHLQQTNNQVRLFTRVVDDYLYITDCLEDAHSFLKALSNYRNVNFNKTVINFIYENIYFNEEIIFLGNCYNTSTLEVSRASNIYSGQMCYKIAFTSGISNINKFIENRVGQSGIPINSHIFNLIYNSEELIWRHIFTTYCLSVNKFCTILAILCDEKDFNYFLSLYKKRVTVKLTNAIIDMLKKNKPKDFLFMYCINHFRYLSWKALYLCAKLTPKCTGLVPLVNNELAKCNCIFGKWREHASSIDINGDFQRHSIKEICRRIDLRNIFKDFDKLPYGFECYHHKKRM